MEELTKKCEFLSRLSETVIKNNAIDLDLYSKYNGGDYIQKVGNYPRSVQFIPSEGNKNRVHPTQKPVALFEYLIKTYTNKGDLVLDNCAGSGTTGVACFNTNRNFILIEKEDKYCKIIGERLKPYDNNLNKFLK